MNFQTILKILICFKILIRKIKYIITLIKLNIKKNKNKTNKRKYKRK